MATFMRLQVLQRRPAIQTVASLPSRPRRVLAWQRVSYQAYATTGDQRHWKDVMAVVAKAHRENKSLKESKKLSKEYAQQDKASGTLIKFKSWLKTQVYMPNVLYLPSRAFFSFFNGPSIKQVDSKQEQFFCTYQGCTHAYTHMEQFHHHIRTRHYYRLRILSPRGNYVYKNATGTVLNVKSPHCQNTVRPGECITAEDISKKDLSPPCKAEEKEARHEGMNNGYRVEQEVVNDTKYKPINNREALEREFFRLAMDEIEKKTYCCPYKLCEMETHNPSYLYRHIRERHDASFPKLSSRKKTFKGPMDSTVLLDESSRNTLRDGQRLTVIVDIPERILRTSKV